MANLDFSMATTSVAMNSVDVTFGTVQEATPTGWSFLTPTGNALYFGGLDMTFDAQGHALSGTVSALAIDVGNDSKLADVVITGVYFAATAFDDGPGRFWRFLKGNDVITLPDTPGNIGATFTIFGDGSVTSPGLSSGGNDVIHANGAATYVSGDVSSVGSTGLSGGADQIDGVWTDAVQVLIGDAGYVQPGGKLTGGNDNIFIESTRSGSRAVGDADSIGGGNGNAAVVVGANDYIVAGAQSNAELVGDVNYQLGNSLVHGGDDQLYGGEKGEFIYGDVNNVGGDRLVGGDDEIWGNGGDDILIGDAYTVASGGRVVAGNDVIYGGEGRDTIYGDTVNGSLTHVAGGNDWLDGEAGDDFLAGGGGDDSLNGGMGDDRMVGGTGNDAYVVDSIGDIVGELAGQGIDIVKSLIATITLADNVENLTSLWIGNFTGFGNGLSNTMFAGGSADLLDGKAGNDVLIGRGGDDALVGDEGNDTLNGGADADMLYGGDGADTASYADAIEGVKVSLDGSLAATGDALGDTFVSIERLAGSDHDDVLRGDAGANALHGGGGKDKLQGRDGNDVVVGGAGRDELYGGAGNDRFDYLALTDGGDTVADFGNTAGNDDTLRFDGDAFGGLPAGALAASRFLASAAGVATTAGQRFIYETDTGVLRYDANGSAAGGVTVIATFTGAPPLSVGDIVII